MKPKLKNSKTAQESAPALAVVVAVLIVVGVVIKILEAIF